MEGCYANRHIAEHPEHNYPFSRIGIIRYQDDGENSSYISHYRKALACDQGSMKNGRYLRILLSFLSGRRDRCGSAYRIPMEACCMKKVILLLFAVLIVYATFFTEKDRLDREVKRLCAMDGGIRVYETVKLPAERFDRYGQISVPYKDNVKPGDEYYYESSTTYLIRGNPELVEYRYEVYRQFDGKLLGELINYSRRGGGMPGPWHVSAFRCPKETDADLKKRIFIKE